MMGFIIFIHTIVCITLVAVILMQSGRGGGLTEGMSGAESLFGAKTASFMVKATAIFASLFIVMCLTLAIFSSKREKSLMIGKKPHAVKTKTPSPATPQNTPANEKMAAEVPQRVDAKETAPASNQIIPPPQLPQAPAAGAPTNSNAAATAAPDNKAVAVPSGDQKK